MSNDERSDAGTHRKTRTPFRIAAFALGVIFAAVGLYELGTGPSGWMDLVIAIFMSVTGFLFAYSAITEQWSLPFAGSPFIHYGVVFFLDPNDESTIHAALPLSTSSELLARRNASEAIRVMPEFLSLLPNMDSLARKRQLEIRMISSYDDLAGENWERIVVEPATAHVAQSEPGDRDGDGAAADRSHTG